MPQSVNYRFCKTLQSYYQPSYKQRCQCINTYVYRTFSAHKICRQITYLFLSHLTAHQQPVFTNIISFIFVSVFSSFPSEHNLADITDITEDNEVITIDFRSRKKMTSREAQNRTYALATEWLELDIKQLHHFHGTQQVMV